MSDPQSTNTSIPQAVLDQNADTTNANKGTNGTNTHYDKAMGHRGTQIARAQTKPSK